MKHKVPVTNYPSPGSPPKQIICDKFYEYKIFTKDDYKRYRVSKLRAENINEGCIKKIDSAWQSISKGFNFIIGVGQEDDLMFWSVEYFNNKILGRGYKKVLGDS